MSSEAAGVATQEYAKGPVQVALAIGSLVLALAIVIALATKEKLARKFPRVRSAANAGLITAVNVVCWAIDKLYQAGDYIGLAWKTSAASRLLARRSSR